MGWKNIKTNYKNIIREYMKIFLKKYWLSIAGAIIVGLFTVMPWFLFLSRMGGDFQGVWPQFNGDAFFYLARTQEIFDGHPEMNHQYFWEHKEDIYPQARGAEYFFAALSKISGLDLPTLQVVMDFVSPAVILILIFILLYSLSPHKYTAVILPLLLFTLVGGGVNKPIHPQITFPILVIFLIFWFRFIIKDSQKILNASLAGLFFGLLFLTYHYHWMFLIVLTGIYFLILLLKKDWFNIKYHLLMWVVAFVIGIPYFIQFWQGANIPYYHEMMVRMGMYYSHLPETFPKLIVALIWLAFFVLVARHYKLEEKSIIQAMVSLLIANVLLPNHQLITGIIIQNSNHWSGMPLFIYAVNGHYLLWEIAKQKDTSKFLSVKKGLLLILIILIIAPMWRMSTFALKPFLENYSADGREVLYSSIRTDNLQYYKSIFNWVNNNTEPDSVILADGKLMSFFPVYTRANVYNTEYAQWLPGSDEEVIERALLANFFNPDFYQEGKFNSEKFYGLIWVMARQTEYNTHIIVDDFGLDWKLKYKPKYSIGQEREKIKKVYDKLALKGWNINLLKKYRLDYIVWDKNRDANWNLENYKELKKVYEEGEVEIYVFN